MQTTWCIKLFNLLLLLSLAACAPAKVPLLSEIPGPRGELSIEVYGFRSLKGEVLISLFLETEGFPDATERALVNLEAPVTAGRLVVEVPPLPHGRYSYSILHDENGDGKMNSSLLGIPKEGYALSNDLEGHFGRPDAAEALFEIGEVPQRHVLRIRYVERGGKGRGPFGR